MAKSSTSGQGRPKGSKNKTTTQLKEMILQALSNVGGIQYLEDQAELNPVAFMSLVGKVLPMTIAGDQDSPIVTEIRRVIVDPNGSSREED
jgi:hypothetical protein